MNTAYLLTQIVLDAFGMLFLAFVLLVVVGGTLATIAALLEWAGGIRYRRQFPKRQRRAATAHYHYEFYAIAGQIQLERDRRTRKLVARQLRPGMRPAQGYIAAILRHQERLTNPERKRRANCN